MACSGPNPIPEHGLDADTIAHVQAASGLDVVRLWPAMYVGSTDAAGLFQLLSELVTNSLAEAVAGYGREVRVTLRTDGSAEVADDGRTLPSDESVEHAFTTIGTGHIGYRPYPSGRDYWHYVTANALAERMTVFVRGDRSVYQHSFRRGATHAVVQSGGPPGDRGLTVAFRPDPEIFGDATLDATEIRDRLRQCAFLHSGVRITFTDEASGTHDEFEFADGIAAYVEWLNANRRPLHDDVILIRGEEEGVRYEVGLQWCDDVDQLRLSFANHHFTRHGGTHDRGLAAGVALGVRDYIRKHRTLSEEFEGDDFRSGLTAVVSVWLHEPMFEAATRSALGNLEVEDVVRTAVRRGVREYFEANADAAKCVVDAVVTVQEMRVAAKAARERVRQAKRSG